MKKSETSVNIAPSSENGHYIKGDAKVIELDFINETFLVEGKSKLVTKNHTTLEREEKCLITCQTVYDPFKGISIKSKD